VSRAFLAGVASGVLLGLAVPPRGWSWCAWVALVPLLVAVRRSSIREAFVAGWVASAVALWSTSYWLVATIAQLTAAGRPGGLLIHASMVAALACYTGAFAVAARRISWTGWPAIPQAAALWIVTEWLRSHVPVDVPWMTLGTSQDADVPVAQLAAVVGPYGVSALVAATNASLALVLFDRRLWKSTAVMGVLVASAHGWGSVRMGFVERRTAAIPLRVGLVQTAIMPDERRWPMYQETVQARLEDYTRQGRAGEPDIVVWPEMATPFAFDQDQRGSAWLGAFIREIGVPLVFGSISTSRPNPDERVRHNRAYLLDRRGEVAGAYDKQVLVPFAEYVPLGSLLWFLRPMIGGEGRLVGAGRQPPLQVDGVSYGVLMCYEAIVPRVARDHARAGARVLLNLSNDAWYTGTVASAQLLAQARLRAIETGIPVVRVVNAGQSAVVSPTGRIEWLGEAIGWESHVALVRVPTNPAPYARYGDAVVWIALGVAVTLSWRRRSAV
jgi:apolipoprotein N-acyltransferase